jgi:hypothetical protein
MVFGPEGLAKFRQNLFCYSSLLRFVPPRNIICRYITYFFKKLAAGRSGRVIGRGIVLQKLVHGLQRLVVLIEDL